MASLFLQAGAEPVAAQTDGTIAIDVAHPGTPIPSTLFGAFFEEINMAGEGGIYGELVRNRSFAKSSSPDFWTVVAPGTSSWLPSGGSWSIDDGISPAAYQQTGNGADYRSLLVTPDSDSWQDYTLTLQARKLGGDEGFLVLFHVEDAANYFWWNLGGWTNTQHAIQHGVSGSRTVVDSVAGAVNTDQWYDIRIELEGATIRCFLDGNLVQTHTTDTVHRGGIGLSTWNTQSQFRNIVVTAADSQVLYQSDFDTLAGQLDGIAVDTGKPLNATNVESLRLTKVTADGSLGVANHGFWGIPLESGSSYELSFHACAAAGFTAPLAARLENTDGSVVYAETAFEGIGADWRKFAATLVPSGNDTHARLVLAFDQPGTVWLDVVSLFRGETFHDRPNGMRTDLADALDGMSPSFLRFPGGCYVEGHTLADAFQWKKTIGDIETRPGHPAYWGYHSSDGLGYHEYLQLSEDLGAEPLFCINAGMSHSDVVPLSEMGTYVQDALDAIEYANGDLSTPWGALRAANGHPEPFGLKYIQIGNENGGADYNDRYALFHDAIKADHPEMRLIACVWGGTPTSRPLDLIDEHYYTNPSTFLSYATKYDSYDRDGPKIFVGEYAVTDGYGTLGNLSAALGEAAFMTGIERNCDIVEMASYAPLFGNLNILNWKPDAIYFDNSTWFGTPAYHVQKMFANNLGTTLLPMNQDFRPVHSGSIGLATWNTQAEFRNITVTGSDSQVLYQSDFDTDGSAGWTPSSGTWTINPAVSPAAYQQGDAGTDLRSICTIPGSEAWSEYTLSLQARKTGGSEGFLIMFNVTDPDNWFWWNIGGWNNTNHAIEYTVNGAKTSGPWTSGSVNTNQWYDIRIEISGGIVNCYLDDVLTQEFAYPSPVPSVASFDARTRQIILKAVNPAGTPVTAGISLGGVASIAPTAERTLLTSAGPDDENSPAAPENVVPVTDVVATAATDFTYEVPAYSVNILRIQTPAAAPSGLAAEPGNQQATLSWDAAAGASGYEVWRATASGGPFALIAGGIGGTTFTDTALANNTTYFYRTVAINSAGATASESTVAVMPVLPPVSPDELRCPSVEVADSDVTVTVAPTVSGRVYRLQCNRNLESGSWFTVGGPLTGDGGPLVFNDTLDPTTPRCFYRVVLSSE